VHFCATPLVLIAENDPLVTACYEDIITDAGASVGASFRSCAEAEEWLSDHYPDAAIVGITLQDGSSVPLAKTLCGRKIPFLVASRFSANSEGIDSIFKSVKWLKKPFSPFELQAALRALLVAKRDS
jgi:DNA-binding response OmpR family regulator